jgi:hypothetical protein
LDLELVTTIAQHHILEEAGYPMARESTHNFCDNTTTIAWQPKGSAAATKVTADLLHHAALHQRKTGHVQQFEHLARIRNNMANDACLLCNRNDPYLLACFNPTYPQTKLWQMGHLSQPVLSELILLLSQQK